MEVVIFSFFKRPIPLDLRLFYIGEFFMNIMDKIRAWQLKSVLLVHKVKHKLAKHKPEMLYIGCIDARLDPIRDIGIKMGTALIHRTIAALVAGVDAQGRPRNISEAASVEFAVNVMKVGNIVVAGHTHCGGLQACLHGVKGPSTNFLAVYLKPLNKLRKEVLQNEHKNIAQRHALEEGSVRMSIENLMTYPFVKKAVEQGKLQLHGWVIDTASKRILVMDPESFEFKEMSDF